MELVNTTLAAVAVEAVSVAEDGYKAARVTAKLTFDVDPAGGVALADRPLPILDDDVETPLGPLPRDTGGFDHEQLELIVNAAAHAPHGRAVRRAEVALQLDERVLNACVHGDRVWIGEGNEARPSEPVPFVRMPMSYAQAYGGMARVWIDELSEVPIAHPANPLGLGLDAAALAGPWCASLGAPAGFPRVSEPRRLPNVEASDDAIRAWSDEPRPFSWSTRPASIPGPVRIPFEGEAERETWAADVRRVMQARCHPDLLLDAPPAWIALHGMTPEGHLAFRLPTPELAIDYLFDGRGGARSLRLRRIVVLPEERRFTLAYETRFRFRAAVGGERSLRVRLDA